MKSQKRNLNPHAEAVAAMYLWGSEYAASGGGSMDFWDSLSIGRRQTCRDLADRIVKARRAPAADFKNKP